MLKRHLRIAVWMTLATTVLFGIVYPLVVTGLAQSFFSRQANGDLIRVGDRTVGSRLISQPFTSSRYFHSRPSAAGSSGYDATASGGSNLGPTNNSLLQRVATDIKRLRAENPNAPVPIDLVTASASGLDPHISPASAEFQAPRVARERGISEDAVRALLVKHTRGRQWGFLGEPRVNVLELNLELDTLHPKRREPKPVQVSCVRAGPAEE